MKIAIFAKKNKPTTEEAVSYIKEKADECIIYYGLKGDGFPKEAADIKPDILISYISPWIIPEKALKNTRLWNINFHPGPPEYPGTGCFNFALYNNEKIYGVTAHIMEKKVDTGIILGVRRFPVLKQDTVYALSIKSYENMLMLFREVMDFIIINKRLPECVEKWRREPYTRKQLEELCEIDLSMSKQEADRRIKAVHFPGMPGAYIDLFGHRFEYKPER